MAIDGLNCVMYGHQFDYPSWMVIFSIPGQVHGTQTTSWMQQFRQHGTLAGTSMVS
jgi:hypothetical protein